MPPIRDFGRAAPDGRELSISEVVRMIKEVVTLANMSVSPPLTLVQDSGGVHLGVEKDYFLARILGGTNPYSWEEISIDGGTVSAPEDGQSGTVTVNPAYHIAGSTVVAVGTIVRMFRALFDSAVGEQFLFETTSYGTEIDVLGGCGPGCGWVAGLTEDDCLRITLVEATGRCADDAENIDDYLTYEGGVWVLDTTAEGGGSGTGPPPLGTADSCTQCATTPYRWSVPLTGFTGDLAILNGVYNIDQLEGYPCTWLAYGPGTGQATQLNINGSAVTLYITPPSGYGSTIEYTATIGSDCCSDLTLTISTPTADCPTTLTITPRC